MESMRRRICARRRTRRGTTHKDVWNMAKDRSRAVLGLPLDATRGEAQRAFRRLAKETHPDLGGDAAAFRAVAGAWADLASSLPAEPEAVPRPTPRSGAALAYRSVIAATDPASRVVWSERRPPVHRPARPTFASVLAAEMARQAA